MSEVCTYTPSVPVKKTGIGIGVLNYPTGAKHRYRWRFFIA